MNYDDQNRQFNYLSGLVLGSLLGAVVALVAAPVRRRRNSTTRRIAGGVRRLAEAPREGGARLRKQARPTAERILSLGESMLARRG